MNLNSDFFPDTQPCPHLPSIEAPVSADEMKRFGKNDRGTDFYEVILSRAQSKWLEGFPAQAILQMNRAFGADLNDGDEILDTCPLPYAAMAWIMKNRKLDQFIGNPRRHFQHYATRMNEPRRELRAWRAWACWWLACRIFPESEFPADEKQLAKEGIVEPDFETIFEKLLEVGIPGEAKLWKEIAATVK